MRNWWHAWDRYWFAPESPLGLAACRVAYFGLLLVMYSTTQFSLWGEIPSLFWEPITAVKLFFPSQPSSEVLRWVGVAWLASLLLSCIGLATRASTIAAFVLGVAAIGIRQCFWKTYHADGMVLLTLGILAASRSGDALSVDAWLARRRGKPPAEPSGEYRWPIRAVWITMGLVFFNAAMSKVQTGGAAWVLSDSFAYKMAAFTIPGRGPNFPWLSGLICSQLLLCKVGAGATIVAELGMIVAPFSRIARVIVVPIMFAMQIGMGLTMVGTAFVTFMLSYLFWIPWPALLGRAEATEVPNERGEGTLARTSPAPSSASRS